MVLNRVFGVFFISVLLLVGLSGLVVAVDGTGVVASTPIAPAAVAVPTDIPVPTVIPILATPSPTPSESPTLSATPSPTVSDTIGAIPSATPGKRPALERIKDAQKAAHVKAQKIRDAANARADAIKQPVKDIRANLTERVSQIENDSTERIQEIKVNQKERLDQIRDKVQDIRALSHAALEQLKVERQKNLDHARELEAVLAKTVKDLREKRSLNDTEKAELKIKSHQQLNASYRHRIELAQKMGLEGANATLVLDFVTYAENNWNQYANATNNSVRKGLVLDFNQHWRAFKQAVTRDLLLNKLRASVNATRQTLARLDAVIVKLSAGGFNTTLLVNASAVISMRLDSILVEPDVPHALARLRQVQSGLVHQRNAIQQTVNRELVDAYREKPLPFVAADASLSINASA
ncbi:hypothetical protein HY994_02965 [Candidatus Micrarchaeota archaeon]|nr:hypothetical protein [Candidatus Micrarchaeota archaeon]